VRCRICFVILLCIKKDWTRGLHWSHVLSWSTPWTRFTHRADPPTPLEPLSCARALLLDTADSSLSTFHDVTLLLQADVLPLKELQQLQGIFWTYLAGRGLGLFPIFQEVQSACLDSLDLGLQAGDLSRDGCVHAIDNLVEGRPLTLDIVHMQPVVGKLEPLALQELPEPKRLCPPRCSASPYRYLDTLPCLPTGSRTCRVSFCARHRISKYVALAWTLA